MLASPPLIHSKSRMRKRACTDLWCAELNRHEVGNEKVLQERRERIHPDRESCDNGRESIVESGSHTVSRGSRSLGRHDEAESHGESTRSLPLAANSGRILIVDDDERQRTALAAMLSEDHFETQVAADGQEAVLLVIPHILAHGVDTLVQDGLSASGQSSIAGGLR